MNHATSPVTRAAGLRRFGSYAIGLAGLASIAMNGACSWSRFGDLTEDAPVVLLGKPSNLSGFGASLETATLGGRTLLLVGGTPGISAAASYSVGNASSPGLDAISDGYCDDGDGQQCFLGSSLAGVPKARTLSEVPGGTVRELCFVVGIGSTPRSGNGVIERCADGNTFALPAPADAASSLIEPAIRDKEPAIISIASDRSETSAVLVGAASKQLSWVYPPDSLVPASLPPPSPADASFGTRVAVLRAGTGFVLAVSAPEQAHVFLYASPDSAFTTVTQVGCFSGGASFGRSMTAGRVDTDTNDDLVVADTNAVTVFDGAALAALPPGGSGCTASSESDGAVLAVLQCRENGDVKGCSTGDFGASLAVGDIDGDNDGEVLVGAPRMKARDANRGGTVLVYDVEGTDKKALVEAQFMSSAEDDDLLGSSVAAPLVGGRHIIAAGAPGGGKTALFYCSKLLTGRQTRCAL